MRAPARRAFQAEAQDVQRPCGRLSRDWKRVSAAGTQPPRGAGGTEVSEGGEVRLQLRGPLSRPGLHLSGMEKLGRA